MHLVKEESNGSRARSVLDAFIAVAVVDAAVYWEWGEDSTLRTHRTLGMSVLGAIR
jgi:hypothetical protein